ncbi:unnamed protein product [Didymodactylos carnosus]|uniref:Carbohydrate sulfotransferase n=1 Tax=Didymodactylos carnosus TaxID=1234261 RepID=A0A815FIY5_9BILA|nr:unnamed protein product [Didymodactylos carnosus]CAF1326003.1 unnamed protein product [Didymodactylos carnosus]CAF3974852.1 unnamed protein product [Didymodactylos carnosus]CAF4175796.1 unnamed protein product [Didymodactylos carnosus]
MAMPITNISTDTKLIHRNKTLINEINDALILDNNVNVFQKSNYRPLTHEMRINVLNKECSTNSQLPSLAHVKRVSILNYLVFTLRSKNLFYCSVPKVATRTLLNFFTYLHIEELIAYISNSSTLQNELVKSEFARQGLLFDLQFLQKKLTLNSVTNNYNGQDTQLQVLNAFKQSLLNYSDQPDDLWHLHQNNVLPLIKLKNINDQHTINFIHDATKVLFVRHPFNRLASAYYDKIATLRIPSAQGARNIQVSMYDDVRRGICRKFAQQYLNTSELTFYQQQHPWLRHQRKINPLNDPCRTVIPTFEHFVEYILDYRSGVQLDVHWAPYSHLCKVCTFKYDFIGKYETIADDMQLLLKLAGADTKEWQIKMINSNRSTVGKDDMYKKLYETLPEHLICKLQHIYSKDVSLFNYNIEDYVDRAKLSNCRMYHQFRYHIETFSV